MRTEQRFLMSIRLIGYWVKLYLYWPKATLMIRIFISLIISVLYLSSPIFPCTNFIVTKGASADGSTFLVYTNDGEWLFKPQVYPAMDHQPGDSAYFPTRTGLETAVAQPAHTYAVLGFQMNEHQVAIGETTFTGREELWNHGKGLEYWHLMTLVLQRAKTAREGVDVLTSLAETYGYCSEGESFSIIDPDEAWIVEMIGRGEESIRPIWVAGRIPDGMISAHANMARIGTFPMDDPENCLYSEDIIDFAIEKGYYNPKTDGAFAFNTAYCPPSPDRLRYCEGRVWSLFRRSAPSLELKPDYFQGVQGAERYPLWIKPDEKLSIKDVSLLVRDHFEGTEFDMTKGIAAGPFGSPNYWRPLNWDADSVSCAWGRPVSSYNTAFSFIAQARSFLPDEIGGICWFGVDDTYYTCYVPIYCNNLSVPTPFTIGDINKFNWESMWWAFNFVSNFSNLKYSYMIRDIQKVQYRLEDEFFAKQDSVEKSLMKYNKIGRIQKLTEYSEKAGINVHKEWKELGAYLIMKYNDGYIKDKDTPMHAPGYPTEWYQKMYQLEGEKYKIPDWNEENKIEILPY